MPDGLAKVLERLEIGEGDLHDHQVADAFLQYKPEAYFTRTDRDAALGDTRVPVCRYVAATTAQIERELELGKTLGCGYALGHPRYEDMLDFLLPDVVKALVADYDAQRVSPQTARRGGKTEITIARLTYRIELQEQPKGAMLDLSFDVTPWMGEGPSNETIERTGEHLMGRIMSLFEQAVTFEVAMPAPGNA